MKNAPLFLATLLLLLGSFFRLHGLFRPSPLHADEALFASLARQVVLDGDWHLAQTAVDKPPTTFITVGLSLKIGGENDYAARVPNLITSLINLAIFYALTKRLTHSNTAATLALFLWLLCPLEIRYAPTVFQDPPMLTALLFAAYHALKPAWGRAGLCVGLAIILKPTALWFSPLIIGMLLIKELTAPPFLSIRMLINAALRLTLGLLSPIMPLMWWDKTRPVQSFIELGNANNNPQRLSRSDELLSHAEAWLSILADITPQQILSLILAVSILLWLGVLYRQRPRHGLIAWWMALFMGIYLAIHWLLAFNTWDRYILPIAPLFLLLTAQSLTHWLRNRPKSILMICLLILLMSYQPARQSIHATDPDDIDDIASFADTLNDQFAGEVIYDHWLSWYMRWYLGENPRINYFYFPTPEDLVTHMHFATKPHYFIAPNVQVTLIWRKIFEHYGITSTLIPTTPTSGQFVIYQLSWEK